MTEQVVVVGAGASGLSAGAALARRGIDALVLDRDDRVGGTWSRRYERLRLHTIRRFSGLAHHPIPKRNGRYLSKDAYAAYLVEYADRFRLRLALGEEVSAIRPVNRRWAIETTKQVVEASAVVLATGHYAEPRLPSFAGRSEFGGRLLHSVEYRSGREFAGERALVVGLGNTGAEIATDLVEQGAASVSLAMRTTPPIVLREMFGVVPVQLFGIGLTPIPAPRAIDRFAGVLRRVVVGDLSRYGIGPPAWGPFTARRPVVIDVGFLEVLKAGKVRVRPALTSLTAGGAVYADGSSEELDVVVAATGFDTGLARILRDVPGIVDAEGHPLVRSGRPTPHPGLYLIGFDETVRGHLFEARVESIRLAAEIERLLSS